MIEEKLKSHKVFDTTDVHEAALLKFSNTKFWRNAKLLANKNLNRRK